MESIQERLCEECAAGREPLESFISRPLSGDYKWGFKDVRWWNLPDSVTEWCSLCRLVSELTDHPCNASSHEDVSLYAYTIHRDEFGRPPGTTTIYLEFRWFCSVRKWFFFEAKEEDHLYGTIGYAHQVPPTLGYYDWNLARHWVDGCAERHEAPCVSPELINLAGFKVIDCKTRKLESDLKGEAFAALSYVWGASHPHSGQETLPNPFPERVIEDALMCATMLKIPYLWVDRYCIDQNDASSTTKQRLLQSMDVIYSAAKVTIVSVAGVDATTGLPGVSTTPRTSLRRTVIHGHCVVEVSNPADHIASSKWITRGWTLQEGVLARRRLVFTDTQIYFQCTQSHCIESVLGAFNSDGILGANFADHRGPRMSTQAFPSSTVGSSGYSIEQLCNEFARRVLTSESDSMRACLGILARLWKADPPVYHYSGLPFDAISEAGLARSLFWNGYLPSGVDSRSPLARRNWGPSWSRLAWKSSAEFDQGHWPKDPERTQLSATLRVQNMKKRGTSTINDYVQDITDGGLHEAWLPYIEITGWIATVHVKPSHYDHTGLYCYTEEDYDHVGHAELRFKEKTDEWLSVMFIAFDGSGWLYSLILRSHFSRSRCQYERMGSTRLTCESAEIQEDGGRFFLKTSFGGPRLFCTKATIQLI